MCSEDFVARGSPKLPIQFGIDCLQRLPLLLYSITPMLLHLQLRLTRWFEFEDFATQMPLLINADFRGPEHVSAREHT